MPVFTLQSTYTVFSLLFNHLDIFFICNRWLTETLRPRANLLKIHVRFLHQKSLVDSSQMFPTMLKRREIHHFTVQLMFVASHFQEWETEGRKSANETKCNVNKTLIHDRILDQIRLIFFGNKVPEGWRVSVSIASAPPCSVWRCLTCPTNSEVSTKRNHLLSLC